MLSTAPDVVPLTYSECVWPVARWSGCRLQASSSDISCEGCPRGFAKAQQLAPEPSRAVFWERALAAAVPASSVVLSSLPLRASDRANLSVARSAFDPLQHTTSPHRPSLRHACRFHPYAPPRRRVPRLCHCRPLDTAATETLLAGGFDTGLCRPIAAAHTQPRALPPTPPTPPACTADAARMAAGRPHRRTEMCLTMNSP